VARGALHNSRCIATSKFDNRKKIDFFKTIIDFWKKTKLTSLPSLIVFRPKCNYVLYTHIRGHLDRYGILTPANHGFRSRHSCESQLLLTTHDLLKQRDQGCTVDMGILDFSKAFDTVPHRRLINKLRIYGIHGVVLSWIEAFLSCRQQLVLTTV